MFRSVMVAIAASFLASPALAETHCATFDHHALGSVFAAPGDVLFRDDIMEVRTAGFLGNYNSARIVVDAGIGASEQVVHLNNAALHLVATVPFVVADALVQDHGGYESVGVMGAFPTDVELHDSPSLTTALAKIDGGINSPDGVGRIHWETTTDQLLYSLTAGGQELSVAEICLEMP
jgi:hypothetical protein